MGDERGLPEHAQAVAEWLRGDRAIDAGWVEATRTDQHTVVILHVPEDVHPDRQEVLAFRTGCALRRFDPDTSCLEIVFASA